MESQGARIFVCGYSKLPNGLAKFAGIAFYIEGLLIGFLNSPPRVFGVPLKPDIRIYGFRE